MPDELRRVDVLLDDAAFFEPFRAHIDRVMGRPSIPIETYLRLLFLKYRYRLGYEPLCREVADSITWQRFCRIPLGGSMPHPTTLTKITARCGETTVAELHDVLLAKAAADRGGQLGVDELLQRLLQQPAEQVLRALIPQARQDVGEYGIIGVGHRVAPSFELFGRNSLRFTRWPALSAEPAPTSTTRRDAY